MTKEEVIEQLESIKDHCKDFADIEEPDRIWHKDIAALTIAIKIIKKDLQGLQSHQANEKINLI